jgi:exonuclease SbcC
MRPIALKVKGFTSFRDDQYMEFADLDLFALWGPTGSGKSSVLDAITYALYGKVERVGDEPRQLVSQGQPRMAVTLDFAAGDGEYRITRTTSAKGSSTVRLERREGDDWTSFGEGADSVREVKRIVPKLIGLDYDAFTRSVILPQGKFAELLAGDERKRRAILTELLGLELFRNMAQRANELAKAARLSADKEEELLEREYAGVDPEVLGAAQSDATKAQERADAATKGASRVGKLEEQWSAARTAAAAITACAEETSSHSVQLSALAATLEEVARDAKASTQRVADARKGAQEATSNLETARTRRADAEKRHGTPEELAALLERADQLSSATTDLDEATSLLKKERDEKQRARKRLDQAEAAAKERLERHLAAQEALAAGQAEHDDAHARDKVGSLVAGLGAGDPCPVCSRPLETLPDVDPAAIERAREVFELARAAENEAHTAATEAEKARALAAAALDSAGRSVGRCEGEARRKKAQVRQLMLRLEKSFAGGLPEDPRGALRSRILNVKQLREAEEAALQAQTEAAHEVTTHERASAQISAEVAEVKARLDGAPLPSLLDRIRSAAPDLDLPELFPGPLPDAPEGLAAATAAAAKELEVLARDLDRLAEEHMSTGAGLLDEARRALPAEITAEASDLKQLLEEARAHAQQLLTEAALAANLAAELKKRLSRRRKLEGEIKSHRAEHAVYSELAKELRSDHIIDFLQAEALRALAAAATRHLRDLSSGRYRLLYEDDRFTVVDSWNGEERRNVKTLSGGETFLASLALSLALSEQVQLLAVTERSRLESLFLDEGFGTLDAETLEVVVGAIEQLGGEGRIVGVITHVPALAERLPVRMEVVKSPRGSSIRRSVEAPDAA